jgi:sodium-coupled neutral amino acid transporter 10
MPFAFSTAGLILGTLVLVLAAAWSAFTSHILCLCCDWTNLYSYEEVIVTALGPCGGVAMEFVVIWLLFGAMTSALVVADDTLKFVAGTSYSSCLLPILVCFVVLPLASFESLGALRYSNVVAVMCTSLVCVTFAICAVVRSDGWETLSEWPLVVFQPSMLQAVPIIMLGMGCQVQVPPVYSGLEKRSPPRMIFTLIVVACMCCAIYTGTAIFGLVSITRFRSDSRDVVPGNVLTVFPVDDRFAGWMRILMGVAVTLVYPLLCIPCRSAIDHLVFGGKSSATSQPSRARKLLETLCIVAATLTTATAVDDLAKVFGITGATAGTLICYVMPLVSFLRLRAQLDVEVQTSTRLRALACICMLFFVIPLSVAVLKQE